METDGDATIDAQPSVQRPQHVSYRISPSRAGSVTPDNFPHSRRAGKSSTVRGLLLGWLQSFLVATF